MTDNIDTTTHDARATATRHAASAFQATLRDVCRGLDELNARLGRLDPLGRVAARELIGFHVEGLRDRCVVLLATLGVQGYALDDDEVTR